MITRFGCCAAGGGEFFPALLWKYAVVPPSKPFGAAIAIVTVWFPMYPLKTDGERSYCAVTPDPNSSVCKVVIKAQEVVVKTDEALDSVNS